MKLFYKSIFAVVLLIISAQSFAQTNFIPELVFQNATLVSGTAGADGAVYRFNNVASGIDATVTVKGRSSSAVVLTNIDVPDLGWSKALQPQLGIQGDVPANTTWWMDFEIRFYVAGTNTKKKIQGFKVTAIDVDGDGLSIQETLQMNKAQSVLYGPVNYLVEQTAAVIASPVDADDDDKRGTDKKIKGPVQNFTNIDTLGTPVMSTFDYQNKSLITFRYGGQSGASISNAGERMNSLWFKAFSLNPPSTLPVKLNSFTATLNDRNVGLCWSSSIEENFSHYVVQRSADGRNFTDIATVLSSNIPSLKNYQYKDANVSSATDALYYRLAMVDESREIAYSPVRVIRLSKQQASQMVLYPNPVINELRVTLPAAWQGKAVQFEIYNTNGSKVQNLKIGSASQTENIQTSSMAKGFYMLKASCEGQTLMQKLVKD
jgi:hypothetical protein